MDGGTLTSERIKEILRKAVQNKSDCGFAAYIVAKIEPRLRKMILDEGKVNSSNYRHVVRDAILNVLSENYLDDEVEFVSGENIADNQRKYYMIVQSEEYRPFDYLNTQVPEIPEFKFDQINDATGIIFWFRIEENEFWVYQHLWSIMVPNKKKTNLLSRLQNYENHDYFIEQKEPLITIACKADVLIMQKYIITSNIGLMQKSFGFQNFIFATANKSVERVKDKALVANTEKLEEYINRGKTTKYAKKVMRIANSKVLDLPKEELMERVHTLNRWKDKFEENQEGLIVLNTYQQVEDLIDLLDERYTRSDVTNQEYDTDVKRVAKPV
ncbi:DUF4868 domain-containing protein [Fusicatenibacter sp.]